MRRNPVFIKLTQWEYWPTLTFYLPLLPFFIARSAKAGHPFFFTTTNPGIPYSGLGTESKFQTLSLLPENLRPRSILFKKTDEASHLSGILNENGLHFPLIAKPDVGFRGYLVKKITSIERLFDYIQYIKEDIIIQEFVPYENELGIFYHRIPDQQRGEITSVTIKKFIKVKGDGQHNLLELIEKHERAFLYTELFHNIHQEKLYSILPKGEELTLSVIGNHSKGTQFINGNHLINEDLLKLVDGICQQIPGWYYGRLDIKYKDYDRFLKAKDFKILEVNGIISEPTHIYDASFKEASYLKALKSINKHWDIMGSIARLNHQQQKIAYPSVSELVKNLWWLRAHTQKLKKLNSQNF